jgi:hypothetical protein
MTGLPIEDTLAAWSSIILFCGLAYLTTGILRATLTCVVPGDRSSRGEGP